MMITLKERIGWTTYYKLPTPIKETPIIVLPSTPFEANLKVDVKTKQPSTVHIKFNLMNENGDTQVSIEKNVSKDEIINVNITSSNDGLILNHDSEVNVVSGKWDKMRVSVLSIDADATISNFTISYYDPATAFSDFLYNMQQILIASMYIMALMQSFSWVR